MIIKPKSHHPHIFPFFSYSFIQCVHIKVFYICYTLIIFFFLDRKFLLYFINKEGEDETKHVELCEFSM